MNRSVEQLESHLVRLLDRQDLLEVGDPDEASFHLDDGDDYIYVTFDLPNRVAPDMDISLNDAVCQVRIEKRWAAVPPSLR